MSAKANQAFIDRVLQMQIVKNAFSRKCRDAAQEAIIGSAMLEVEARRGHMRRMPKMPDFTVEAAANIKSRQLNRDIESFAVSSCVKHKVKMSEIKGSLQAGRQQRSNVFICRAEAMFRANRHGHNKREIGRYFGITDRSVRDAINIYCKQIAGAVNE